MSLLKEREKAVLAHPDGQVSRTDPDSRLMQKGKTDKLEGYNVQTAVDTEYKLIVTHEVTTALSDRDRLSPTTKLAQDALKEQEITVLADREYYSGAETTF